MRAIDAACKGTPGPTRPKCTVGDATPGPHRTAVHGPGELTTPSSQYAVKREFYIFIYNVLWDISDVYFHLVMHATRKADDTAPVRNALTGE
jgi:hypothetical protein